MPASLVGKKRSGPEMLDQYNDNTKDEEFYDQFDADQRNKRFKYAEEFEDINDIFALQHWAIN